MNAIRKQEWKNAKKSSTSAQIIRASEPQLKDISSMPSLSVASSSTIATPRNVLFSRTGRRYSVRNDRRSFKRPAPLSGKNPIRNGKYLLCRQCNADDHFIRDCPMANRPAIVYYAASATDEDVFNLSM
eukprot:IDg18537t1